jgi:CheY-like chemotaxis protein/tRNA A-37 threonylcarbamoyl transferase component Bud32
MSAPAILIVEGNQAEAEDLAVQVHEMGYRVAAATISGSDALHYLQQETAFLPDLILMDISLPGDLDGIDVANVIRGRWLIPIIYLTAWADEDTLARAKATSPDGYVIKPYQRLQLRATIEVALAKHQHDVQAALDRQESYVSFLDEALAIGPSRQQANLTSLMEPRTVQYLPQVSSIGDDEDAKAFLHPPTRPGYLGRLDHYEVMRVVGHGAGGTVMQAFDETLHRVVAIKLLAPQLATNKSARVRFIREARAMAAISSSYLVQVYGVGDTHGVPYLVMEFISGVSLAAKLQAGQPLPVEEIVRIGYQTACGLAAAHAQGLIHRDIKPNNLLLEPESGRVKITDFGLARSAEDLTLSKLGTVCGTPQYMAPEQATAQPIDQRTDLFSLGSVLYAMCTGRPAFQAPSNLATLKLICEQMPPPIQQFNPEVPDWLVQVVNRLHAKNPADRFQSAAELAEVMRTPNGKSKT